MRRIENKAFTGENALVMHTGGQLFPAGTYWEASDSEEGILLGADGRIQAAMPGMKLKSGGVQGDLFVFRRDGVLEGVVGAGEIFDAQGRSWGGFGRFRVSVLMPRRLLKDAQSAFEQEAPLKTVVSVHLRPILRSIMEDILSSPIENPAALRGLLSRRAAEAMEKPLLLRGLKLDHFEIVRFERTEV